MKTTLLSSFFFLIPLTVFAQLPSNEVAVKNGGGKYAERQAVWLHKDTPGVHEFSIWGGYAFDSFKLWGKTPDATLGQFGLGYNRRFLKIGGQVFKYRFSINLFSKVTYPEFSPERNRTSLTGFGISPIGFKVNFLQKQPIQPFLETASGILLFDNPFPDERGKKFNFTLGVGGGIDFLVNSGSSLSFGYKFFHLSNGESGQVNPGIDSSYFFLALTFF